MEDRLDDGFGYHGSDQAMSRYAVSDTTGKVRIENLPKIPIVVEVLIPTSNFPEPGVSWDLAHGDLPPATSARSELARGRHIRSKKDGPSIAELKENETVRYPKLIVRPQFAMDLAEWISARCRRFCA